MQIARTFHRFVDEEQVDDLNAPITMGEIEGVLKWFKKDKSPGPDSWPIEFNLHFFELLGRDLLLVIEESRTSGRIYDGFNSNFMALIPKHDHPESFHDYRPISLCNCIYKIISKIIANRIKPILSAHIAKEKYAFLHHRQIHEAIGTSQEVLHSIKTKNLKSTILKMTLLKLLIMSIGITSTSF